jgi:aminotransferase EvaB
MAIQTWAYLREYEAERDEILAAVQAVLGSGRLILGPSVARFEAEFAGYCGVRHGVGVDNGTNAITLGLRALGVGPGDEVITVANTAVPTISAVVTAGATPRFVDVDPATYLMDTARLEAAVTPRTACILPVHLFGQCVDMAGVRAVAAKHGLAVLEDCAQAHGAAQHGRKAGSLGDAAAFSFYPTKILGAYGDGGMVLTPDDALADRVRRLRFYGMRGGYSVVDNAYNCRLERGEYNSLEHGYNCRLDEVQAEILRAKLRHLDEYVRRRQDIADRYNRALAGTPLVLPREAEGNVHAYYLYVVRHPQRDRVIAELRQRDVHVNVSYPCPVHLMDAYQSLGYRRGDLPHTEAAADEIFSLPMYPSLTDAEQEQVCAALAAAVGAPAG